MTRRARPYLLATSLLTFLCVSGGSSAGQEQAAEKRAANGVAELRKELGGALRAALENGPPVAVDACRLQAPQIAERLSARGVRVGRTSRRLRNPANAPEPWMLPFLEEFDSGHVQPGESRTLDLGDGRLGYVEPIYVQALCTVCHGTAIEASLRQHIRELYPEDQAVGYEVNDLRGLFWATADE